jgi:hypothetical protein
VLTLEQAWALARIWYEDRLAPDWRRRTPAEVMEVFAAIGVEGEFWRM